MNTDSYPDYSVIGTSAALHEFDDLITELETKSRSQQMSQKEINERVGGLATAVLKLAQALAPSIPLEKIQLRASARLCGRLTELADSYGKKTISVQVEAMSSLLQSISQTDIQRKEQEEREENSKLTPPKSVATSIKIESRLPKEQNVYEAFAKYDLESYEKLFNILEKKGALNPEFLAVLLCNAVANAKKEIIQFLLSKKVDVNCTINNPLRMPLSIALQLLLDLQYEHLRPISSRFSRPAQYDVAKDESKQKNLISIIYLLLSSGSTIDDSISNSLFSNIFLNESSGHSHDFEINTNCFIFIMEALEAVDDKFVKKIINSVKIGGKHPLEFFLLAPSSSSQKKILDFIISRLDNLTKRDSIKLFKGEYAPKRRHDTTREIDKLNREIREESENKIDREKEANLKIQENQKLLKQLETENRLLNQPVFLSGIDAQREIEKLKEEQKELHSQLESSERRLDDIEAELICRLEYDWISPDLKKILKDHPDLLQQLETKLRNRITTK